MNLTNPLISPKPSRSIKTMPQRASLKLDTKILLAPLAGCSDLPFRLISREHGARLCFFEMVDANSLVRGNRKKTLSILKTSPEDAPSAAQIIGCEESIMKDAASEICDLLRPLFLDINAACPVRKVTKKGAGAALLANRNLLFRIIKSVASSVSVPVTVKIRTGYSDEPLADLDKLAVGLQENGASAIFIHGRTRQQGYSGDVDYASIRMVKESVGIPVIGSGNIFSADLAMRMFDKTTCDAITVARGALGNPWIFKALDSYFKGSSPNIQIKPSERKAVLKRHLKYIEELKDSSQKGRIGTMRKVAIWYTRGFAHSASVRQKISLVKDYDAMLELVDTFF